MTTNSEMNKQFLLKAFLRYLIIFLFVLANAFRICALGKAEVKKHVFIFRINHEIDAGMWRITQHAINQAIQLKVGYILIELNTYGGAVDAADSIRTKILNCNIPVLIFIDNNAASAGALIAISGDSIYMRKGANIGAATVVNQSGQVVPDKYQSYMRGIMRSTAEAHGKYKIIKGNDTIMQWRRDPKIAEAMVDPRTYIKGLNDTGKVLTMTTEEALVHGYCEGRAENVQEVLKDADINNYEISEYKKTLLDDIMGFLMNPILHGILIMIIVAGIYFEMQSPGVTFPILAAGIAALLYFAPLYVEGLAANWEIIAFIVGLLLLALEVFVIPGFGVTGIAGIILVLVGLTMALVNNVTVNPLSKEGAEIILRAFALVISSIVLSFGLSIYFGSKMMGSRTFKFALQAEQARNEGYVGVDVDMMQNLIGKPGIAKTVLRPSGTVEIDGMVYDAKSESGFLEQGTSIIVERSEAGQLYVVKESA